MNVCFKIKIICDNITLKQSSNNHINLSLRRTHQEFVMSWVMCLMWIHGSFQRICNISFYWLTNAIVLYSITVVLLINNIYATSSNNKKKRSKTGMNILCPVLFPTFKCTSLIDHLLQFFPVSGEVGKRNRTKVCQSMPSLTCG